MYKEIKNKESNAEKGKRKPPLSIRDGFLPMTSKGIWVHFSMRDYYTNIQSRKK